MFKRILDIFKKDRAKNQAPKGAKSGRVDASSLKAAKKVEDEKKKEGKVEPKKRNAHKTWKDSWLWIKRMPASRKEALKTKTQAASQNPDWLSGKKNDMRMDKKRRANRKKSLVQKTSRRMNKLRAA